MAPKFREHTVTVEQLREAWGKIQAGQNPLSAKQRALAPCVNGSWRGSTVDSWIGCSGEQMNGWLCEGYYVEGDELPQLASSDTEIFRRKRRYTDEGGEMIWERVMDREEKWQVTRDRAPQRRGMKIRACFDFNCETNARIMRDYFAWILQIIDQAERQGISPDVELFIETRGSFQGEDGKYDRICIPVVKAGELVDTVAWRAFLTRGGFRTLGFLALGLIGDRTRKSLTGGLGSACGTKWDVTMDEDRTLTIHAPGDADRFPLSEMNTKLAAAQE
jgi:hypothetical protein